MSQDSKNSISRGFRNTLISFQALSKYNLLETSSHSTTLQLDNNPMIFLSAQVLLLCKMLSEPSHQKHKSGEFKEEEILIIQLNGSYTTMALPILYLFQFSMLLGCQEGRQAHLHTYKWMNLHLSKRKLFTISLVMNFCFKLQMNLIFW